MLPAGDPSSVTTESLSVTEGEPTALLGLHQPSSLSQHHPCSGKAAFQSGCSDQWGFVMLHCHTEAGWPFLILHGCLGPSHEKALLGPQMESQGARWDRGQHAGSAWNSQWKLTGAEALQQEHMAQLVSWLPLEYWLLPWLPAFCCPEMTVWSGLLQPSPGSSSSTFTRWDLVHLVQEWTPSPAQLALLFDAFE